MATVSEAQALIDLADAAYAAGNHASAISYYNRARGVLGGVMDGARGSASFSTANALAAIDASIARATRDLNASIVATKGFVQRIHGSWKRRST
jgi:hypothetical protein